MSAPDPSQLDWMTRYFMVIGLSMFGGLASYLGKVRKSKVFSLIELTCEIVISGFTGILTYFLVSSQAWPWEWQAAAVGVSGHMGSKLLSLVELWAAHRVEQITKSYSLPEDSIDDQKP